STGSSLDCSAVGQLVTCTRSVTLGVTGTTSFTIHVTVGAAVADGTHLFNTASVSSGGTTEGDTTNNDSNTTDTTVQASADVSITKTDGLATVTAGDGATHTYTITVHNGEPSNAQGVTVTDSWPAGFTQGTIAPSTGSCA